MRVGIRRPGLRPQPGQARRPGIGGLERQRALGGRSVSATTTATGRPRAPPRRSSASTRSIRRGQSRASAQVPSSSTSSGPVPVALVLRVQDRPGEAEDHRRHRQHPQQQQPPRRPVGLGLVVGQAQQQRDARETAAGSARAARRAAGSATGSAAPAAPAAAGRGEADGARASTSAPPLQRAVEPEQRRLRRCRPV